MMRLFKSNILKPAQVEGHISSLEPRGLNFGVPKQAINVAEHLGKSFTLAELVIEQTGLSELQKKNLAESIEVEVLKKLKEVEEKAFAEAHKLGMEEGRKEAFNHYSAEIQKSLDKIQAVLGQIDEFKNRMFVDNEDFFIKLVFQLAKSITLKEINEDPALIIPVLTKVLDSVHSDEEMILKLNQDDFEFLKTVSVQGKKSWENTKKLKLEPTEGISRGGCILETNHGIIDAQIEQRLNRAWSNIESRIPKVNPS